MSSRHFSNWDRLSFAADPDARAAVLCEVLPLRSRVYQQVLRHRPLRELGLMLRRIWLGAPRRGATPHSRDAWMALKKTAVLVVFAAAYLAVVLLWDIPEIQPYSSNATTPAAARAISDANRHALEMSRARSNLISAIALACILFAYVSPDRTPLLAARFRREGVLRRSPRTRCFRSGPKANRDTAALASDIESRRAFWIHHLAHFSTGSRLRMCNDVTPVLGGFFIAWPLLVSMLPGTMLSSFGIIFLLVGPTIFVWLLSNDRLRRIRTSLAESKCPDCSYPLLGLPDGEPRTGAVPGIGPRRCCECGTPWPLLPPPIPVKQA